MNRSEIEAVIEAFSFLLAKEAGWKKDRAERVVRETLVNTNLAKPVQVYAKERRRLAGRSVEEVLGPQLKKVAPWHANKVLICLRKDGKEMMWDIIRLSRDDLARIPGLGSKLLSLLMRALKEIGVAPDE